MIILNHCKKPSEIIHCVLHKKSLAPILYTKKIKVVSKYCETIIHSLQQHKYSVGHSGCRNEISMYSQVYLLKLKAEPKYRLLRKFFFQPVKSLMKPKVKTKLKSLRFWFGKHGTCAHKCPLDRAFPLPITHLNGGKPLRTWKGETA